MKKQEILLGNAVKEDILKTISSLCHLALPYLGKLDQAPLLKTLSENEAESEIAKGITDYILASLTDEDDRALVLVLLHALIETIEHHPVAGKEETDLRHKLAPTLSELLKNLRKQSTFPSDLSYLATHFAMVDAAMENDLQTVLEFMGKFGSCVVIPSETSTSYFETLPGVQIPATSKTLFATRQTNALIYENPFFLITDKHHSSAQDFVPILQYITTINRPLIVIAPEVKKEALATLMANNAKAIAETCIIEAPFTKDAQKEILEDLSIFTGAELISEDAGYDIKHIGPEMLGAAKKIIIEKGRTTILQGFGNPKLITLRSKSLVQKSHSETVPSEIHRLKVRSNNLSRGIGVMHMGGDDQKVKFSKIEKFLTTLKLTKMCQRDGVLPNPTSALYHLAQASSAETISEKILVKALQSPLLLQVKRLGICEEEIAAAMRKGSNFEFNPKTEQVEEIKSKSCYTPYRQISSDLNKALRLTLDLINTDAAIVEHEIQDKEQ